MLSVEDNALLTQSGPDTPLGTLLRRFWTPVATCEEIGGSAPARVRVLGQDFVAFRDASGHLGLLDAYCPHRRANLYWGRNEQDGLRCVYHGWKFDIAGRCIDLPNCPEGETLKDRVQIGAYPTVERGGLIWAYLGPRDRIPAFPSVEVLETPPAHRHIVKVHLNANYLQAQEGDVDLGHTSFLHSRLDSAPSTGMAFLHSNSSAPPIFQDRTPKFFAEETDYGFVHAARRVAGAGEYSWRIGHYLMPYIALVPGRRTSLLLTNVRVPIDDEHSAFYRMFVRLDRPLGEEDRPAIFGGVMAPEMIPESTTTKANKANDYLMDREIQRTQTYTGIGSIVVQDMTMTEDQDGAIVDRSREYLVSADRTIIVLRKKLLDRVKGLMHGDEPAEAAHPAAYAVRSADLHSREEHSLENAMREAIATA